jgi:PAS domain S-box-containing protein
MDDTLTALALRESEELHRITLMNMSDAVFITNDEGSFTFICPNVDVIFGFGPEEVRSMKRISHLLGRDLVDHAQLAVHGEIRNIEHEVATKRGTRRALLVHIKQVAIKGGTTLYVCRDVTERKESERALRRNEERLTLALEAASMGMWDLHVPSGEMSWSPETHRILGDPAGDKTPSFDSFLELVHAADRDRVSQAMIDAMDQGGSYEAEFRVVGYDDVERWVMGKGKAVRNGKPLRMLGVVVDFTDRHRLEDERRELSGRLIHAHEQERIRIARELHDDVAQRLSLLAVELSSLARHADKVPSDIHERIVQLSAHAATLGSDLHRMSHELHPATLEQLGLETAIRAFCRELSNAHGIAIDVNVRAVAHPLPQDVALCVYRVTQEALRNVVRHSGASTAIVTLAATTDEIVLNVTDSGAGFDVRAPRDRASLGLRSMLERVWLVNGQLAIHSKKGEGTRIEARVPLQNAG